MYAGLSSCILIEISKIHASGGHEGYVTLTVVIDIVMTFCYLDPVWVEYCVYAFMKCRFLKAEKGDRTDPFEFAVGGNGKI